MKRKWTVMRCIKTLTMEEGAHANEISFFKNQLYMTRSHNEEGFIAVSETSTNHHILKEFWGRYFVDPAEGSIFDNYEIC